MGVLPFVEQPGKFKLCSKLELWVVAEKILVPITDHTPVALICFDCKRALALV